MQQESMNMTIRSSTRPPRRVTEYMHTSTHLRTRTSRKSSALDPPGCTSPSESRNKRQISRMPHIDACATPLCRCLKAHVPVTRDARLTACRPSRQGSTLVSESPQPSADPLESSLPYTEPFVRVSACCDVQVTVTWGLMLSPREGLSVPLS
ncbi:hypothetical protein V8C26DRAFT_423743 [Trichoderma gracile]